MSYRTPAAPPIAHIVADLDEIDEADEALFAARRVTPIATRHQSSASALVKVMAIGAAATSLALLSGCATTGATFRSGVGDAMLEHAPYYAGAAAQAVARDSARIGHLPIAYQRGAAQAAIFDPRDGSGSRVDVLLEEMNAYLDGLGLSVRLVEGRRVSAVAHAATATPPDVSFGCLTAGGMTGEDCAERGDSALGRGNQAMRLAVGRPAESWTSWMRDVMADAQAGRALVVTLEVGQYLPRQRGWRGTKEVELGSDHVAGLPWLTSLETPVMVLQLTGALMGTDGKAIRIGAEGLLAKRTRLAGRDASGV